MARLKDVVKEVYLFIFSAMINKHKPMIAIDHGDGFITEVYVIPPFNFVRVDGKTTPFRHDRFNYHFEGPCIVVHKHSASKSDWKSYPIDAREVWTWIDSMVNLGQEFLDQNVGFDFEEYQNKIDDDYENSRDEI